MCIYFTEMPACSVGDDLRLICMGKGLLTPDNVTLAELGIPSFKTHATPVNVSVKRAPDPVVLSKQQQQQNQKASVSSSNNNTLLTQPMAASTQGCGCVIQ
jgi:Ubiquitin-2 like Rad60 SUMO-like